MKLKLILLALLGMSSTAHATLTDMHNGMVYDSDQNLTWLQDANAAGGAMSWADANTWAGGLTMGGVSGWRLPTINTASTPGSPMFPNAGCPLSGGYCGYNVDTSTSELAYMFDDNLGNVSTVDYSGNFDSSGGLTHTGPFSNLDATAYWSSVGSALDPNGAWTFNMLQGSQGLAFKSNGYSAWAVHEGQVSAIPVPAAAWLFGAGLIGLVSLKRNASRRVFAR
ncbi:MAG: DUF1566 domain-containing protein [Methylococcales bacterium]|nr:DUF1566 domain-containing protein [Methylococcales bacterium]